jgi:hypothetical protein
VQPLEEPARLMEVAERHERLNLPYFASSTLNYQSWKAMTRTFEQLGAFGFATYTLLGRGERRARVAGVACRSGGGAARGVGRGAARCSSWLRQQLRYRPLDLDERRVEKWESGRLIVAQE